MVRVPSGIEAAGYEDRDTYQLLHQIADRIPRENTPPETQRSFAPLNEPQSQLIRSAASEWLGELEANFSRALSVFDELDRASYVLRRLAASGEVAVFCNPSRRTELTLSWLYGIADGPLRIPPAKFEAPLLFSENRLWLMGERHVRGEMIARNIVIDGAQLFDKYPNLDPDGRWIVLNINISSPMQEMNNISIISDDIQQNSIRRNAGGRPLTHDWIEFFKEVAIYTAANGLDQE